MPSRLERFARRQAASKAAKPPSRREMKNYVKKEINKVEELKTNTIKQDNISIGSTATIVQVSVPPQGDEVYARDGNKISLEAIQLNYMISGSLDEYNRIRVMLIQWKEHSPEFTGIDQVLEDVGSANYAVLSGYKTKESDITTFRVLYDKVHTINQYRDTSHLFATPVYKNYLTKGFKKSLHYDSGATTGTDQVFLVMFSDSDVVDHPDLTYQCRIRFRG